MAKKTFPVLVATDGSAQARAAVDAAVAFPWPRGSEAHGVVSRGMPVLSDATPAVWDALFQAASAQARSAERRLRRRWPEAEATVTDLPPVPGILAQARKLRARAIVIGSRGLGAVGRFLLGSVSRAVVRQTSLPVLVVRGRTRPPRRFLVGVDGSPHARAAVACVASLTRPAGGRVTLLGVVEPVRPPSTGPFPTRLRALVTREAANVERERVAAVRRELATASARLTRAGWRVRTEVRLGRPLEELLAAARDADVLVVGARGVGAFERLILGSVAEGVVTRATVPVLIVR